MLPIGLMLAVVAHQFVCERREVGEASAPSITSPTDQQLYSARAAAFSPTMPCSAALPTAEDLIEATDGPKHGGALPTTTDGKPSGHDAPQAGGGMNGTEPSWVRTSGSTSIISSTIAQA
jgi:hypothetical protein